MHTNYFHC